MAKKMNVVALCSTIVTILCIVLYVNMKRDLFQTLAITFGTTSYHFIMRLLVGKGINLFLHNNVDYKIRWFCVSEAEQRIYKKLGVKKWKSKMPTYDQSLFDHNRHTWDEIAQVMCQAEIVHEVIIVLSFVPVIASIWYGALLVFVITSFLAACVDAMFVIMQRYNRARIMKMKGR